MRARPTAWFLEITVALILAGYCALCGWMLYDLRKETWNQALTSQTNLLNALAQDIGRNVEVYDLSLQAVVDNLKDPDLDKLSPELQNHLLYDRSTSAQDLGSILVLDETGKVIRGSKPGLLGADLSERDYFRAQKARPSQGLYISAPFIGRMSGRDEVIALSRSVLAPDGSFAGVVVGTMRLAYFQKIFSRADLGQQGSINLFREDGTSLMRVPYQLNVVGRNFGNSELFQQIRQLGKGTLTGRASVDGVRRVYTFNRIGNTPLILDVALGEAEIFAVWQSKSRIIGAALAALCLTAAALCWRLRRQFNRTMRAEAMLSESEAEYRLLAENAQDLIVRLDQHLRRTYVSPAARPVLGYDPEELTGETPQDLIHPEDWPSVAAKICQAQARHGNAEATYRIRHKLQHYVWMEARFTSVPADGGFTVVLRDITKRKEAEEQLERLNGELAHIATIDALTGLANRRRFDEVLSAEWRRAAREGKPVSLLLLDVDRFKAFNDEYGHQQGDACLQDVGSAVQGTTRRPGDLAARYGGEELAIILPGTDEVGAAEVGERVRLAVETLKIPHQGNPSCGAVVTISVGCATLRPDGDSDAFAKLVEKADLRLYEAKRTGRNRVQASDPVGKIAPPLSNEKERLSTVALYTSKDAAGASPGLDQIAQLAAQLFNVPTAYVSLVSEDQLMVAGRHGLETTSAPRNDTYCAHTILGDEPLVVPDTRLDPRFADSPFTLAGTSFYAGAPLVSPIGHQKVGALCICDNQPHPPLDERQRQLLSNLAKLAMDSLERRRKAGTIKPEPDAPSIAA